MIKWFNKNKNSIIRTSFLLPILLVVFISISHVISWYSIGNPFNWAIYLSVAIEIFALTSVSASSININKTGIWFLFLLVTCIQLIGNVFFTYNHIDIDSEIFISWVELIQPLMVDWSLLDHKRLLSLIQGGTLPLMSLTALHFYLKFNDNLIQNEDKIIETDITKSVVIDDDGDNIIETKDLEDSVGDDIEDVVTNNELTSVKKDTIPEIKKTDKKSVASTNTTLNSRKMKSTIERIGTNKYKNDLGNNNIRYDNGRNKQ